MASILSKIALHKKQEVLFAKNKRSLPNLLESEPKSIRDFTGSLQKKNPAIIAEIKKASPSKGILRESFNVSEIAQAYEANGACCLSILTDIHFFQGHPDNIQLAKSQTDLPILRKDFIVDDYQVYESLALGADCILLIVALLDDYQLMDYCQLANELNLAVLVESHTHKELERALNLPTPLIGINNRSLHSFETNLNQSIQLRSFVPQDRILISESGIQSHQDIVNLQAHGINTFLVGEQLMRANNIGEALRELIEG
ncbi:indole-3-glycerol phosphate synthase TrpC [Legionella impletisoli]|uniref:Indole-3-glycerol phosphate synthase n=1 Tax=Legionella impletisoli TaxID=343510 RepID=A0A917JR46_9GAMM|nr:indole-3-glycerol phosphate synthase TrpC [Legionella impletisoli]GGI80994.1 indole-3-glycerol phosphate synthase [Legionella impletisoli]